MLGFSPGKVTSNPGRLALLLGAAASSSSLFLTSTRLTGFNVAVTVIIWLILTETIASQALVKIHSITSADGKAPDARSLIARKTLNGGEYPVPVTSLRNGDLVLCETNEMIPADGIIVQGTAIVDESAITGQSPPVLRESGGEWSAVFARTTVLGGRIVVRVAARGRKVILDRAASTVKKIKYQMTSDEKKMAVPLWLLVSGVSAAVMALPFLTEKDLPPANHLLSALIRTPAVVSILVCALPFTAAELLDTAAVCAVCQLVEKKVMPASINALESAADVNVLILEEKEVVTFNRQSAKGSVLSGTSLSDDDSSGDDFKTGLLSFPAQKIRDLGLTTVLSASSDRAEDCAAAIGAPTLFCGVRPEDKLAKIQSEQSSGRAVAVAGDSREMPPVAKDANLCFVVDGGAEMPDGFSNAIGLNGRPNRLINAIETGRCLCQVEKLIIYFAACVTVSMSLLVLFPLLATLYGRREIAGIIPWLNFIGLSSAHSAIIDMLIFTAILFAVLLFIVRRYLNGRRYEFGRLPNAGSIFIVIAGLIVPFITVKLIDLAIVVLRYL